MFKTEALELNGVVIMPKVFINVGPPASCFVIAFAAFSVEPISNWLGLVFLLLGIALTFGVARISSGN